eukprot:TRINITY_DN9768_c0_g1_i3.p1 TRINITY_DN9768_c0_g1~~TRINITY_DN9768_c0_g1_i3.p1  ORF type:complete len:496 (+),score=174.82 TRINITY_DN9768_c0_g1_i3:207-1694(+)
MSVVGFDFGHQTSVIAVARGGGIDTIANEVSNRLTPSMVSFGAKERFLGEAAMNQLIMNFKNTLGSLQTFLGRKFSEKEVQEELKRYPVPAKELPNGEVGFQVQYNGEQTTFSVVQLVAMILHKLKTTTEKEIGGRMSDAAISCPGYFTDAQRRALLHASEIAGINCVRLLNETTATALYWGFYRRDLPENDPIHVMFIDCGYKNTSVSIVDMTKKKKIRNTPLKIDGHVPTLSKKDVQSFLEEEGRMQSQDRLVVETVNAKNAVESYILGMRNRLSGDLSEYATQEEKDKLESVLSAAEDWLYDEGDDATKGVYVAKKAELQKLGDPISDRKIEHEKRAANYSAFKKTVEHYRAAINDPKYEHIEAEEKNKILQAALESENHLDDLWHKQSSLSKVATPVLRSDEINSKKEALERLSNQILSKPKPAPPAPAPAPAPTPAADANKSADATPANGTEDTPMADADSQSSSAAGKPTVDELPTENTKSEDTPMTEA